MPFKRRRFGASRRRRFGGRRRFNRRRHGRMIRRGKPQGWRGGAGYVSGIPQQRFVKFKYVDDVTFSTSLGGVQSSIYRANSAYDPNYAVGGHQPLNFNKWAQMYSRYMVVGSKIRWEIVIEDNAGNGNIGIAYGVFNSYGSVLPTLIDYGTCMEYANGTSKIINSQPGNVGQPTVPTYSNWSWKKFYNTGGVGRESNWTSVATSPPLASYYHCWVAALDGLASYNIRGTATMEFSVIFGNPILPSPSFLPETPVTVSDQKEYDGSLVDSSGVVP